MKEYRIVFVLGYDRSGTTLVGKLLNNYKHVLYVGEIDRGLLHYNKIKSGICGCGSPIKECSLWSKIFIEGFITSPDNSKTVYDEIVKIQGCQFLIDSSKMIGHVKSIQEDSQNYKIIHLVRNPKGVIYSRLKSRKHRLRKKNHPSPIFASMTTLMVMYDALEWSFRNLQIEKMKNKNQENFLSIYYESLNYDFEHKIIPFLKIEFSKEVEGAKSNHIIYGNRNKFEEVNLPINVDSSYSTGLTFFQKNLVDLLTFPIRKIFKYKF